MAQGESPNNTIAPSCIVRLTAPTDYGTVRLRSGGAGGRSERRPHRSLIG